MPRRRVASDPPFRVTRREDLRQAVLLQKAPERAAILLGFARCLRHVAAVLLDQAGYVRALERFDHLGTSRSEADGAIVHVIGGGDGGGVPTFDRLRESNVLGQKLSAGREHRGALQNVVELANVAGPMVGGQYGDRGGRQDLLR